MPRRSSEPTERLHVWLYTRDVERIAQFYPSVDRAKIIRAIIRVTLDNIEAKLRSVVDQTPVPIAPVDITELAEELTNEDH